MIIKIDMAMDTPIYEQLRREIIKGILNGQLTSGEVLPSVRNMAESLSINMHTVSKAYQKLKAEGFLSLQRNNRATINDKENYAYTKEYLDMVDVEIERIVIEAKCKGLKKEVLMDIVEKSYNKY